MPSVITSLALALGQLADGKVLRILLKSLGVTVLIFLAVATAGWFTFNAALEMLGLDDALFMGAGGLRGLASFLLALVGLWLIWRITAMAVIQFYAEDIVKAVEARHYPKQASAARDLAFAEQMRASLGGVGRALAANLIALPFALALLFTGIGTALLFWAVNALLIGRELQDMVWLRHQQKGAGASTGLCPVTKLERFMLGGVIAAMLALPFVNFLAPVLGAAGAAHLVHRKVES